MKYAAIKRWVRRQERRHRQVLAARRKEERKRLRQIVANILRYQE